MDYLTKQILQDDNFLPYLKQLENEKDLIEISGLSDVGKIQILSATLEAQKQPICYITYNEIQARKIINDLSYFRDDVAYFPKREIVTYDYIVQSKDNLYERMDVLKKIKEKKCHILVTSIEAVMQKMVLPKSLFANMVLLKIGSSISREKIQKMLSDMGYERTQLVEAKGQFSIRGDIVDIAISDKEGIRIEFWGDDVDSIRRFSLSSQRTIEMEEKVSIFPAHEFILERPLNETIEKLKNEEKEEVLADVSILEEGEYISKVEKYFNTFYTKTGNLTDYLKDHMIILDEPSKIEKRIEAIKSENEKLIKTVIERNRVVPDSIYNIQDSKFEDIQKSARVLFQTDDIFKLKQDNVKCFNFPYREVNLLRQETKTLIVSLKEAIKLKRKILILVGKKENEQKLQKLFEENNLDCILEEEKEKIDIKPAQIVISLGAFSSGFECKMLNLLVITSDEFFQSTRKSKKLSSNFRQSQKIVFADLKIGDLVVHRSHGIGVFTGVNTITADGITKDYIKIKYRNDDMLYVPTETLDNVRKYIGSEGNVKLNKLGSKEWESAKAKVKNNLRQVAKNLIELYAKREHSKGFKFSKDTGWQNQFEESFPYQETNDQLKCIEEVKKDMEEERPMDRLLCGDVGYGKTEVALRAAFKAVMDQKQVAYLAPTTILAQQQYQSFMERMKDFPIGIEVLNRFKTKKQQEEIAKKVKLGEIDILIGTHRILSKDISFKDLGLLIVDEEHRFGVKDKEKIKEMKATVDVLTMTATPIPRTLQMSIVGIRDMSVIYEPPQDRKPVQTYVLEYDKEVIKEAITKELERNGQVFYLYNNVEGIEKKASEIEKLIPEAKVDYAHGKMPGTKIEDVMQDFVDKNIDVLVCTTILESGIDIPNANTIIVENADRLGLAQLYQIRGRVGRSDRQAYAYITYRREKMLSEDADKRLKAIKEFTEFGSGFKIAMRDLEIRGAGSLLGEIQHGHMDQVGYDTYCKLLDDVVKEMQGVEVEENEEITIDLNISSYIPEKYIQSSPQKIEVYQDIALCRCEEDIQNVADELIDRYGNIPEEVENLMEIARIKIACSNAGVVKIMQKPVAIQYIFNKNKFNQEKLQEILEKYGKAIRFSPGEKPLISCRNDKLEKMSGKDIIKQVKEFLKVFENKGE